MIRAVYGAAIGFALPFVLLVLWLLAMVVADILDPPRDNLKPRNYVGFVILAVLYLAFPLGLVTGVIGGVVGAVVALIRRPADRPNSDDLEA